MREVRPAGVAERFAGDASSRIAGWARVLGLAVIVLAPLILHAGLERGPGHVATGVAAVQAGVLAWFAAGIAAPASRYWIRPLAASAGSLASIVVCRSDARLGVTLVVALSHATLYGTLLAVFTRSLMAGSMPVATRLALRVHATITPERRRYTRKVTQLWASFFAFELAGSVLLLLFARGAWWSWFVNVLDLPLMIAVFAGEFAVRCWWFRGQPHGSLADMARLFGRPGVALEQSAE